MKITQTFSGRQKQRDFANIMDCKSICFLLPKCPLRGITFLFTDISMIVAIIKAVFKGSEYRASDTRAPFDGTNLDETRGRDELGIEKHFDSLEYTR